ncbi:hypothetical protein HDU96_002068 [Phlyctochytrium bullatum]|nr:hypothetical protein HDU96_002068 [Phlyctochytrium bullatum]
MVNPKAKGKQPAAAGMMIEDVEDESGPQIEDGDDFDVDNMDFDLPPELVGPSGGQQPLLMTKEEAARMQRTIPSSSVATPQPSQPDIDPAIKESMKTWTSVYPVYLDAGRSTRAGRMIPAPKAIKEPSIVYITECCKTLRLNMIVDQRKRHPKDPLNYGRIRIQIRSPTGQPMRSDIPNKKALLLKIAEMYAEVEEATKKSTPMAATAAAALRSEMQKTVDETIKEAKKANDPNFG